MVYRIYIHTFSTLHYVHIRSHFPSAALIISSRITLDRRRLVTYSFILLSSSYNIIYRGRRTVRLIKLTSLFAASWRIRSLIYTHRISPLRTSGRRPFSFSSRSVLKKASPRNWVRLVVYISTYIHNVIQMRIYVIKLSYKLHTIYTYMFNVYTILLFNYR